MDLKRFTRGPLLWILGIVVLLLLVTQLWSGGGNFKQADTSTVLQQIRTGNVSNAKIIDKEQRIEVTLHKAITIGGSDTPTKTIQSDWVTGYGSKLTDELQAQVDAKKTDSFATDVPQESFLVSLLVSFLPIVIIVLIFLFIMNQMQGGGSRVMSFGKSKAKLISKDTPKTTFADVAGADEAIEELQEIKEFLQAPAKFQAIGAKIPKGVLLYGPPGTGKTLLARAVAGEAGVPFYSISGSDFVEMFVGVGASRVRDLFEQAKANAPAIIFIDEIDAVGRHRGAGLGGGHDEREQTLNQLLVEMDGFDVKGGVILIAATNRPDILDPALLRPGRFDRQVTVDRPDLEGRKGILKVHGRGKPFAPDVDLDVIARRTPGFTGADLANVINEAALLTARADQKLITMELLEESIDRVMAGPERKTRVMSDKEKKIIAYHEGGHALVAHALPNSDPVHKITILSRGRALGYTMTLPMEDKFLATRSEMMDQLAMLLGGRAAEELVFHEPTTGASNDIEKATADRPPDGDRVRHERAARRPQVRHRQRRGLPGPRDGPRARLLREDRFDDRRGGPPADRDGARPGVGHPGRIPRRARQPRARAHGEGDALPPAGAARSSPPWCVREHRPSYAGYGKRLPSDRPPILTPKEQSGNGSLTTGHQDALPSGDSA